MTVGNEREIERERAREYMQQTKSANRAEIRQNQAKVKKNILKKIFY